MAVELQDWACEAETSSVLDRDAMAEHPHYGLPSALKDVWDGRLSFCVTETAPEFGGYLEGALASAEWQLSQLIVEAE